MATQEDARREHPSTYVVQDRTNETELIRLNFQDQMLTTSMGGVLPEQPDPPAPGRILDVACGTGAWLIETASTCPQMSLLIGVDISKRMIEFATSQARRREVSDRVEFHTMDALRMLEFPNGYFDLVNQRLGMSYLRTWDWPKLLQECLRVTRWGGTIRLTESDVLIESSSPALMRSNEIFLQALIRAGHLFTPDRLGILNALPSLLSRHGCTQVHTQPIFWSIALVLLHGGPFSRI
jgi:ubiquinone/menaquinone biosynthesis C-methylase UbiE